MRCAAVVSRHLAERMEKLVPELLPNGRPNGREWRVGSVEGEAGSSLAVCLFGLDAGLWHDFATGESGDALDLVRAVLHRRMGEALEWSRRWLDRDYHTGTSPARFCHT